jgi:hypothetical protein
MAPRHAEIVLPQQLQYVRRAPLVRLLLPHIAGPDLRRIPHPQLVADLRQQIHQPVTAARRLHADQRRPRQLSIETFCVVRGLRQLLVPRLSRLRVQPVSLVASWDGNHILK